MTETETTDPLERAFAEAAIWGEDNPDDPKFSKAGRVHDWRNYVPEPVREAWPKLDRTARLAVFLTAKEAASAEEWD